MLRDPRVEQYLTLLRVSYDWRTLRLRSVRATSPDRGYLQARVTTKSLDDETVDLYVQALQQGMELPAIVVNTRPDSTYDILGGYHRTEAMRRVKREALDAYVLNVDDAMAERVCAALNSLEGKGSTRNERILQAMRLIKDQGYSHAAAAQAMMVAPNALHVEAAAQEVRERLKGKDIDLSKVSSALLEEASRIVADAPLEALLRIVVEARVGRPAAVPYIQEIRRQRSEGAQMEVVQRFAESDVVRANLADIAKGGRPKMRRASNEIWRGMGLVRGAIQRYPTPAQMNMTVQDFRRFQDTWAELQLLVEAFSGAQGILRSDPAPRSPNGLRGEATPQPSRGVVGTA